MVVLRPELELEVEALQGAAQAHLVIALLLELDVV
jgi:hypothetical protein